MTRILFVDDESRILDGLRRTLRSHRNQWEMAFALGGEAALAELERAPYDVIVSDMRMPQLDGLALLTAVRERWPRMVRIVLSGQMDMETAVRAVSVAHQFLTKPCDATALEGVIGRARQLLDLLADETLRGVVGRVGGLPTPPALYAELERAVADPNVGLTEVSRIVERDVSLTVKVLQVVNSSFFGLPRRVTTVEHAVAYLGANVIRALVLSHELTARADAGTVAPGFSLAAHQEHALRVANLARRILGSGPAADDAFMAGVLHDVGELVLATQRPEWFARATALAAERGVARHEAEAELFGVSHAEVGAYLIGLWGLPSRIVEAIAYHHAPARAGAERGALDVLAAVHIADALVGECAPTAGPRRAHGSLDASYVESLGVTARLPEWRAAAAQAEQAAAEAA
jgi:HD-like signal output (HDOD) protein